jgi:adenylate cyclase
MPERVSSMEIERKFLAREVPANLVKHDCVAIEQGYLAIEPDGAEVRLRRKGDENYLTVKRGTGEIREETEIRLSREQFERLWPLTTGRRLSKTRCKVPWQGVTIELDIYHERHEGLIVAEVEFRDAEECRSFRPPPWLGDDISEDPRYKNRNLGTGSGAL